MCPDLIITECPLNCKGCNQIWVNEFIGNRIICICKKCNHNKTIKNSLLVSSYNNNNKIENTLKYINIQDQDLSNEQIYSTTTKLSHIDKKMMVLEGDGKQTSNTVISLSEDKEALQPHQQTISANQ